MKTATITQMTQTATWPAQDITAIVKEEMQRKTTPLDSIQITQGAENTIFELYDSCPPAHYLSGHLVGEPGIFLRMINSNIEQDNRESWVIVAGPLTEDAGNELLDTLRSENEAFVTA